MLEPLKVSVGTPGYMKKLVHMVINQMHQEDPRWTQYLNVEKVHLSAKYRSLFRYINDKLRYLKQNPRAVQTATNDPSYLYQNIKVNVPGLIN